MREPWDGDLQPGPAGPFVGENYPVPPARSALKTTQGLPARSSVKTGHWPVFRALLTHWIIFRAYLTHRTVFRALLTPSGAFGIRRMNRRTYFESDFVRSQAPMDTFQGMSSTDFLFKEYCPQVLFLFGTALVYASVIHVCAVT